MTQQALPWYWRFYDVVERAGTGAVIGWFLTFPVMWAADLLFGREAGMNGWAGDYAWYGTIPLGVAGWLWLRRGRPGGWVARAAFGGLAGFPAALLVAVLGGMTGDAMLGAFLLCLPGCAIAWPLIVAYARPKPPPAQPPAGVR